MRWGREEVDFEWERDMVEGEEDVRLIEDMFFFLFVDGIKVNFFCKIYNLGYDFWEMMRFYEEGDVEKSGLGDDGDERSFILMVVWIGEKG